MPYEIKMQDDKHCVYKEGEDTAVKCHGTREEAVKHMKTLMGAEGIEKSLIEIEKCHYSEPYYFAATSFEELDKVRDAAEARYKVYELADDYRMLTDAVLLSMTVEDKATAIESLSKEFVARLRSVTGQAEPEPEEEVEEELPEDMILKEWQVRFSKSLANDERRIVYGIVLKPDEPDSQGDLMSVEDIEKAAHQFFVKSRIMDHHHAYDLPAERATPVESYIAPQDLTINGHTIRKGSWVMATHVPDDEIWSEIKKGGILSYSIRGLGRRTPLE